MVKNLPANAGDIRDACLIHGWGRSPRGGHDNRLQYSCLENPMNRGALWAESETAEMTACMHASFTTNESCNLYVNLFKIYVFDIAHWPAASCYKNYLL